MDAVLAYALDGNAAVQWKVQNNATRKWYHAPGLLRHENSGPTSGREFIRGLTRERPSRPGELASAQTDWVSNWAVGFFNPIAAYTIGKVWHNPNAPDSSAAKFDDGAVAFKLLFTTANSTQAAFLANSLKWQANVDVINSAAPSNARSVHDVLLLQVDIAVRDDRANPTTGWVFGTFMYQNDAPGVSEFDRLVPVGLMWGNDPALKKPQHDMGVRPVETWLNTAGMPPTKSPHFGWLDRLNGPVDNPHSSCLSCHARAVVPYVPTNTAPQGNENPDSATKKFFSNTKAGEVYDGAPAGTASLDYSLQLAVGVRLFPGSSPVHPLAAAPLDNINFRSGEPDPTPQAPERK